MNAEGRTPEDRERARLERAQRRGGEPVPPASEPPTPVPPTPVPRASEPPAPVSPTDSATPSMPPQWDGGRHESFEPPPVPPRTPPAQFPSQEQSPPPAQEFERPPAQRPSAPPASRNLQKRSIGLIALGVVALAAAWFLVSLFQPFAGAGKGEGRVAVTIPQGADVAAIGELLAQKDVVASARKFGWRAGWSGKSEDFKAGRYEFGSGMSYAAAIDLLAAGPNAGTTVVTVPEGRSRWETAQQVRRLGLSGDYMAASQSSALIPLRRYGAPAGTDSLEGFLFPATYEFPVGAAVEKLVRQQAAAFRKNIATVDFSHAKRKNLTVFDVVTIASLIDREVSLASERKLVAAVIYNRLKAGIPLGIDATSRFETRNWTTPLTNAVLQKDTPYNTRINKGLPPGPIGSPGLAAIEAAADPASSGYLYYVANPCRPGTHTFTKTYEEFQAAADRYNRARERAGGRQPSGC